MKSADVSPARDKVLFQLKSRGPQTAAQICAHLGVTAMAIRQHLYALAEQGLVAFEDQRRKVGRPTRVWRLTDAAARRFPDTHGDLTVDLLQSMRATFGDEGLERLLAERARRQLAAYAARMPGPSSSALERVRALTAIRSAEGYMAEWSQLADGSLMIAENHCPICAAATTCQALCRDELALFRAVLGDDVGVTRSDHILAGARRCCYLVTPASASPR